MPDKEKAGRFAPGRMSRTFARVPLDSITEAHLRGLPHKWAVLFMLMSYTRELEDGTVAASCPVDVLCERLGLTRRQVKKAAESLRADGLLRIIERGHNGRASVYAISVGSPSEGEPTLRRVTSRKGTYDVGSPSEGEPTESTDACDEERVTSRRGSYSAVGSPPEGDPYRSTQKSTSRDSSLHEDGVRSIEKPAPSVLEPVSTKSGMLADLFAEGGRQ